ncbi:MAG: hypothetical protein ACUVT8_09650 [Armatimonadota bacterium]
MPPVVIEANSISTSGVFVRASGDVFIRSGGFKIRASEIWFDTEKKSGSMNHAIFTTCDRSSPDYHLEARNLTLLSGDRIRARGVAFYIGRFRVISLRSVTLAAGRRGFATDVFPRPSYDEQEGAGIAQKLPLVNTGRWNLVTDLRFTTRRGLIWEAESTWGINGELTPLPSRLLTSESLQFSGMPVFQVFAPAGQADSNLPRGASLRQFLRFAVNQRVHHIRYPGLAVSKQPEISLSYVGRALGLKDTNVDPQLLLHPVVTFSAGRYEDNANGGVLRGRVGLEAAVAFNLLRSRHKMAVQPVFGYSVYNYEGDQSYSIRLSGLDISRIFRDGSSFSLRYLNRVDSGASPFVFDTVQVAHDLQGSFQVRLGSQILGFAAVYDAERKELYGWRCVVGYCTDCMATWFSWDSVQKRLMLGIALINL